MEPQLRAYELDYLQNKTASWSATTLPLKFLVIDIALYLICITLRAYLMKAKHLAFNHSQQNEFFIL